MKMLTAEAALKKMQQLISMLDNEHEARHWFGCPPNREPLCCPPDLAMTEDGDGEAPDCAGCWLRWAFEDDDHE